MATDGKLGIIINTDVNAAYNIIRKIFPEAERVIIPKKCNIDQFKIAVAEAASALKIKMENFRLIVEISGNIDIPDYYELEIFDGKSWHKVKRDTNLCIIIDAIMDAINIIFKTGKY